MVAGIDSDPSCKYAYEKNNGARFIEADVAKLSGEAISKLYPEGSIKILIGCAPCQPFSNYTNKLKKKNSKQWSSKRFRSPRRRSEPEIVSMENVPSLGSKDIFKDFMGLLKRNNYYAIGGMSIVPIMVFLRCVKD